MEGGNYRPSTADEVWKLRYGDCKGKTALLVAMLDELGIRSDIVLASNAGLDDGIKDRLPSPVLFDHVLVRAEIDGQHYWLDPTLPDIVGPTERPIIGYRHVLPLTKAGHALERLDPYDLPRPIEMATYDIDASAGFDEPAKITQTSITRGVEGIAEYMQHSSMPAAQLETYYKNALTGSDFWKEVDSVTYRYDRSTLASILTIVGSTELDWDERSNGRVDYALPGGGFSPPSRRERPADDKMRTAPFYNKPGYSCHVTTVIVPEDTDLEHWGYNSVYETTIFGRSYQRMMERNPDRTIRMIRSSRVDIPEVEYSRAATMNDSIEYFDNSKAVIEYNPDKLMRHKGLRRSIPTIKEIDWIEDTSHCIPTRKDRGRK